LVAEVGGGIERSVELVVWEDVDSRADRYRVELSCGDRTNSVAVGESDD
jgi:hypothetical protein